jgi:hypothetical protein
MAEVVLYTVWPLRYVLVVMKVHTHFVEVTDLTSTVQYRQMQTSATTRSLTQTAEFSKYFGNRRLQ